MFNGDCYAGFVLLFRNHWNGAVCRIRYAQLLQVSIKSITIFKCDNILFPYFFVYNILYDVFKIFSNILNRNTTVEDFYEYSVNGSTALGYYYLNTFDNLIASGITLFELTVVNNWFIQMNAYAFTAGMYTRMYFMIFYLVTMIVLTIVVSSFLEAFRFRIQYKKSTSKHDGNKYIFEQ